MLTRCFSRICSIILPLLYTLATVNTAEASSPPAAISVASGNFHTCALWAPTGQTVGTYVSCWGRNDYGQIGIPPASSNLTTGSLPVQTIPAGVQGISSGGIKQLSVGGHFGCVLLTSGQVQCWGNNGLGQLGTYPSAPYYSSTAVTVPGYGSSHPAVQIAAGGDHVCALDSNGWVSCWGSNQEIQLGSYVGIFSSTPVSVSLPGKALSITAGDSSSCAVLSGSPSNTLYCWGDFAPTLSWGSNNPPIQMSTSNINPTQISAGLDFLCGITSSAGLEDCWGGNEVGQFGDGWTGQNAWAPLQSGPSAVSSLATGPERTANCSISTGSFYTSGSLYCWGNNGNGQVGDNKTESIAYTPHLILSGGFLSGPISVSGGYQHTCALATTLKSNSSTGSLYVAYNIYCWGDNSVGQYGNGTTVSSNAPVLVYSH